VDDEDEEVDAGCGEIGGVEELKLRRDGFHDAAQERISTRRREHWRARDWFH
jgi:hypothetical protein